VAQAAPAILPATAAARGRERGLVLHVSAGHSSYAVGEQVELNIALINRTDAGRIWLDCLADGAVEIERLTRTAPGRHSRAVTVHPQMSTIDFDEGLGTGWGGDCSGSSTTCTLQIGSQQSTTGGYSLSVTAYFDATDTGVG
jgi:hypothetical protein